MRPFSYQPASSPSDAVKATSMKPGASDKRGDGNTVFLAGGTTLIDLMKLDVSRPTGLVDVNTIADKALSEISFSKDGLRIGALAKMSAVADDATVKREYPMISQSLEKAASAQLRNMASMGGNLLQRTRCSYFRDVAWKQCNKREPGSGCAALDGQNRLHAILAVSDDCIASYPGDFGTAFVALDGSVEVEGPKGKRTIKSSELHLASGSSPSVETTLQPGEFITALVVPAGNWARRSAYLKIRDRESYEFAAASAAVALEMQSGKLGEVRVGLGGVAGKPWRSMEAEAVLRGQSFNEDLAQKAAEAAFADAKLHKHNAFKKELGQRTLVRALMDVAAMEA